MQANIRSVSSGSEELHWDAELDHVPEFAVETDTGNRYSVHCIGPAAGVPTDWEVRAPGGALIGRVSRVAMTSGFSSSYRYKKAGAIFSGGSQGTLRNAVQSLLE